MKKLLDSIEMPTFLFPAILVLLAIVIGIGWPQQFGEAASAALGFITQGFGWYYALIMTFLVAFCVYMAVSKYGNIRLGGEDAKPEMSFFTWFSIALTSGLAIGIVFYAVGEPLGNFTTPPGFAGYEANSAEAAEGALKYVFMHWGLHPYAAYTGIGLCLAFLIWNGKKKSQVSTALIPLIGEERANGTLGKFINGICIFTFLGALGTSLGLAVMQIASGINYAFGVNIPELLVAVVVIFGFAAFYIIAACSGLHKAIKHISNMNMYMYFAILAFALVFGGLLFILNNTTTSIGEYLAIIVPQSFYLEPGIASGWINGWTIFYWGWWMAAAPLVGLFLVKLAKGRTIRQFVLVNMLAPTLFAIVWFGVFGSSAINLEMLNPGSISEDVAELGIAVSIFSYFKQLPFPTLLAIVVLVVIVFSYVTMAESNTLVMADMTTKEDVLAEREAEGKGSPKPLRIFWGAMLALIAFALYFSGGLTALQTSAVACALLIMIMVPFMCISCIRSFRNRSAYDKTLSEEERMRLKEEEDRALAIEDQPRNEGVS